MSLDVVSIAILSDNYSFIVQSADKVAVIDPGDAAPLIEYLEQNNLTPDYIFNTHHHWDHTDGNKEIAQKYNAKIIAPRAEESKIGHIDIGLNDNEIFKFGDTYFKAIETKGHTQGHLCLWFEGENILFSGDMIFAMGCGRPFEGDAHDLYESFQKLSFLPDETVIYFGHEYTQTNGHFSLSIAPTDTAILSRMESINRLRRHNKPTIPTTMKIERETNLFMRAKNPAAFKTLRDNRNNF